MKEKKTTVKDIAKQLNISVGTVSKSLTNKKGVREETRQTVLKTARELGYHVNILAQGMARKPLVLGVLIPKVWKYHYGMLELGMRRELNQLLDYNVKSIFEYVSGLIVPEELREKTQSLISRKVDAVIMCPSFDKNYARSLHEFNASGIPVFLLGTDINMEQRICCVGVNNSLSGNIAGEFMKYIINPSKRCAALIGNKDMQEHAGKLAGFIDAFAPHDRYIGSFETQDDPDLAYIMTQKILNDYEDLGGIYVATGNSLAVCECLEERGKSKDIAMIATDIFPKVREKVYKNVIQGVMYQDQIQQGEEVVKAVFDYFSKGKCKEQILVMPQLIMKSNIDYYQDYVDRNFKKMEENHF